MPTKKLDTAKIQSITEKPNRETEKLSVYQSKDNVYKVITFNDQHIKSKTLKHIGLIEKNNKHLSRLYPSKLKFKNNVVGFVGTDLKTKITLFFNFYSDGKLEIRTKKGGLA